MKEYTYSQQDMTDMTFSTIQSVLTGVILYSSINAITADTKQKKLSCSISALLLVITLVSNKRISALYKIDDKKQIFLERRINWLITFPLLIFDLFLKLRWIELEEDGDYNSEYLTEFFLCIILSIVIIGISFIQDYTEIKLWPFSIILLLGLYSIIAYVYYKNGDNNVNWWVIPIIITWSIYSVSLVFNIDNYILNFIDISKAIFAFLTVTII